MIFIRRDTMTAGLGVHVTICLVHILSQDAHNPPSKCDTILHGGRGISFFLPHIDVASSAAWYVQCCERVILNGWCQRHKLQRTSEPPVMQCYAYKQLWRPNRSQKCIHPKKGTSCWRWPQATGQQRRGPQTGAAPSTSILDPGEQAPAILTFWEGEWKQEMWCGDWDTNERQLIFNSIIKDIQMEDSLLL